MLFKIGSLFFIAMVDVRKLNPSMMYAITASKAQAIVQNVQGLVLPLKAIQQLVFGDDQRRGHVQVRRPEQPHQPIFGIGLLSWSNQ
jgi:hypothetical protein